MEFIIPSNTQMIRGVPVGKLDNLERRVSYLETHSSGGGFTYTDEFIGTGDGDGSGGTTQFNLAHVPTNIAGMQVFGYGGPGSCWKYILGVDYLVTSVIGVYAVNFLAGSIPLLGVKIYASYA